MVREWEEVVMGGSLEEIKDDSWSSVTCMLMLPPQARVSRWLRFAETG